MTTSPQHDRPAYDVIAVHDGRRDDPSFGHTIGLPDRYGCAELLVRSVPDTGVDAGEQWSLSPVDLHSQLAEAVDRLRAGLLHLGDSWSSPLDGGRSALVATVVEADDQPACVGALDAPVWRLHLALLRPPPGRFVPLDPPTAHALLDRVCRWHDAFGLGLALPPSHDDSRFGPGSDGVRLVLTHLAGLGPRALQRLAALEAASDDETAAALVEAEAIGRTSGRQHWARAASAAVGLAIDRQPWMRTARGNLPRLVGDALEPAAIAWVVADLLDPELFRRATASLRATLPLTCLLEHEAPADPGSAGLLHQVVRSAAAGAWPPHPAAVQESLLPERAAWLLAWSGRGRALVGAFPGGLPAGPVRDALHAAVVVDLDPGLTRLLAPATGSRE